MLRLSTLDQEGTYSAAKWLKVQALVEEKTLAALFQALEPFTLHPLTGIVSEDEIAKERFLRTYGDWIRGLKEGKVPSSESLRSILAAAVTTDPNALWLQPVSGGRFVVKIREPVIQIQSHFFAISGGEVKAGVLGPDTIFWGLQFSYPTIFQSQETGDIVPVDERYPNSCLWNRLRQWVRDWTRPTPLLIEGRQVHAPIRIDCEWKGGHPQLPGWEMK